MSVDLAYLKSKKVSSGDYKKVFSADPADYTPRQKRLVELLRKRTVDGLTFGLKDWKAYHAIDLAVEVPFAQTTPTLVQNILSKRLNAEDTMAELDKYGLSKEELFLRVPNGDTTNYVLNPPVFFQLFIPLVLSYLQIRLAKIFNERNTNPLFQYRPLKETTRDEILCDIETDVMNRVSTWYGYPAVLRQAIQQMLKYGVMIAFPREEWHYEYQMRNGENGPEKVLIKEGLRYHMPHPTRMFYDLNYPLPSINTDTGCEYAGHWYVSRYGDFLDDRKYWNRRKVMYGTNWFDSPLAGNYFSEVFPCNLQFPVIASNPLKTREDVAGFYNTNQDRDRALFLTEHCWKLTPADWDLGDYKYPVWHRFTVAGDNTVVWAEPCAYTPPWFMGYDWDENAARNPSFALQLIPFQDHLGNILSQMILTAKQNLLNLTFYNNQEVEKADIDKLKNSGEQMYRGLNFIGFDPLKFQAAGHSVEKLFHQVQFGYRSINEYLQMVPMVLNILDRVMQVSAQEAGAAASHQQSKAEIVTTGGATTNRVALTAVAVDEGTDAWMRQLHQGFQAYGDPEIIAQISGQVDQLEEHLRELGFDITHRGSEKWLVSGHKKALRLEEFAIRNQGPDPGKEREVSQIIFQVVGTIAAQPDLHKKIGADNLIKLVEQAARLAGAPRSFELHLDPNAEKDGGVSEAILSAIKQAQQATLQSIQEKIAAPAAQAVAEDQQKIQQLEQVVQRLQGIFQIAEAAQEKTQIKKIEAEQKMQQRQQAFEAEQHRKQEQHNLEMQQEVEAAKVEQAIKIAKAKSEPVPA